MRPNESYHYGAFLTSMGVHLFSAVHDRKYRIFTNRKFRPFGIPGLIDQSKAYKTSSHSKTVCNASAAARTYRALVHVS